MKIMSLTPQSGPFETQCFAFCPGINVIRGQNGIGKTMILEYASLLGHLSALEIKSPLDAGDLLMQVKLSAKDVEFLDGLDRLKDRGEAASAFHDALASISANLPGLKLAWKAIKDSKASTGPFEIRFTFSNREHGVLKEMLADEARLNAGVSLSGDANQLLVLRALNLWSRPRAHDKGYLPTPRFIQDNGRSPDWASPATSFYVNTDMYDFGIGLDIRESPKDLKKNMTEVFLERLQLVQCEPSKISIKRRVAAAYTINEGRPLLCDMALKSEYDTTGEVKRIGAWSRVFRDPNGIAGSEREDQGGRGYKSGKVFRRSDTAASGGDIDHDFRWAFHIGDRQDVAEFVSSGENQALFILSVLHGLAKQGSCMIFDEPELHLTFGAGTSLMDEIFDHANRAQAQAIIVTHLPHLHRDRVEDGLETGFDDEAAFDYDKVHMIFLRRGGDLIIHAGLDAVNEAARSSHYDVMRLVSGLRLREPVPSLPKWLENWLRIMTVPALRRLSIPAAKEDATRP